MKTVYCYMIAIASIIYIFQRLAISLPNFINNYVNDFLCIPIVLAITQLIIRYLKKDKKYKISKSIILFVVLYYSLYFELYLPKHNQRYTADIIDVLLYFSGGYFFYRIEKKQ